MGLAALLLTPTPCSAADAASLPERHVPGDFDRDGVPERLVGRPGLTEVQHWDQENSTWAPAGYALPEGVFLVDPQGQDAGLRLVDLNGDGFLDLLFSNADRYAIHLWTKDVQPHLGWTRGWSQFVRAGERQGKPGEPPRVDGADVSVETGQLVIRRRPKEDRAATEERFPLAALVAFDVPPPLSPEEALASLRVRPGFRVELVAAEPVVIDPIAFDWGADGRLWVVEMRDYPTGMDGRGRPGGVVKILEDRDGDGRFERMTPFLEDVPFPSSVMPWRRGALITTAPDLLYAEDTDGDGRADRSQVILTGFHPGNQQHRINGFEWGFDGWIYLANGDSGGEVRSLLTGVTRSIRGRDLRLRPDTGEFETVSAQTQYGRRRDDWGNWFGNNNPTWLWHVTVPEHYLRRNPKVAVKRVSHVLANYENSTRVFPASPPMVRPNQPWSLNHVTSACSPSPYRDDLFGSAFATSVFICEPVHNAVHREVLERDGAGFTSHRADGEEASEFLASTDNWFRPTTTRTGPDGALYVADMYRFVIEHPEWISPEMQARLDLRAGDDRGRLYRIVPEDRQPRAIPNLQALSTADLVQAMDSPGGWQRDMSQRLLLEHRDPAALPLLRQMLSLAHPPKVRLQALATLGLLDGLDADHLTAALHDPHPSVRIEALRQSEAFPSRSPDLFSAVAALAADRDPAVRLQAAYSLGFWSPNLAEPVLRDLAARDGADENVRTAILSSLRPDSPLFAQLDANINASVVLGPSPALVLTPSSSDRAAVIAAYATIDPASGDLAHGQVLFTNLCATCHRLRGTGYEVGPDLAMVSTKPTDWLLLAILDPNQAIDARYQAWTVTLKSGDEFDGLIAAETSNNLVLRAAGGLEQAILRDEIETLSPSKLSLMPDGFESALKPQDMADLLRWLQGP